MLESVSLQKNRLRSAKNVIFFYCAFWSTDQWGGFEPPKPPLRTPLVSSSTLQPHSLQNYYNLSRCAATIFTVQLRGKNAE